MTRARPAPRPTRRRPRRGSTLFELAVAFAVLAAVTALLLPAARRADSLRRETERRRRATVELAAVLTDLSHKPLAELPAGPVPVAVRPGFAAGVPGAAVSVVAAEPGEAAGVPVVRLDGELTWATDAGATARPVRLSAWAVGEPIE